MDKKEVAEVLKLLATGDVKTAGNLLARALEGPDMAMLGRILALVKAGNIADAIVLLEQMQAEMKNQGNPGVPSGIGEAMEAQRPQDPDLYLYVPDKEHPSTWKLPVVDENGEVTVAQLGRAAAALGPGFRGQTVDLPPDEKRKCAKKLLALYRKYKAEAPPYIYEMAGEKQPQQEGKQKQEEAVESGYVLEAVSGPDGVEGKEWEVVLIKAGESKNKNFYPPEVLQKAVPLFEGAKAYDSHVTAEQLKVTPGRKVGELLGWFDGVHWDESKQAIVGHFHTAAGWLREMMLNAYKEGKRDLVGFSIDAYVNSKPQLVNGENVNFVEAFDQVNSVDVVCEPAAGGEVLRVIASVDNASNFTKAGDGKQKEQTKQKELGGSQMTKEEIVAALKAASPEERVAIAEMLKAEFGEGADDKVLEGSDADGTEDVPDVKSEGEPDEAVIQNLERLQRQVYNMNLKATVQESGLPKEASEFIVGLFKDKIGTPEEEIKRAIESQRTLLNKTVKANVTLPAGIIARPVFDVNAGQAVLNRLLGVAEPDEVKYLNDNHIGWMGIREWYVNFTGDEDFHGAVAPHRVTEAAVTTTTANSVVKNALNKLIAKRMASWESKQWWKQIVDEQDDATLQQITAVKEASLAALGTLSEGETYPELTYQDAEETASFSKYGAFLGVTLESFMRDDLNALRNLPNRLVDSWNYAMSDLVSATFTDASGTGPTLTETGRVLFNSTDGNLGTTALSYSALVAARTAMRKLTALGNSRRIGVLPKFLLVPPDLEATAIQLVKSEKNPDNAENGVNVLQNSLVPIVVNSWTDTDNWYLLADPADVTVIQLHYYKGQRKPELFTADNDTSGALFTNDTIRYKVRFWTAKLVIDWRGAYGNVV
jgi:hypothetical protein